MSLEGRIPPICLAPRLASSFTRREPIMLTEQTPDSLSAWIRLAGRRSDDYLFPSRLRGFPHVSTQQYARIVHGWVREIGLDDTVRYLGIEVDDALEMAEQTEV
jgi:integrase